MLVQIFKPVKNKPHALLFNQYFIALIATLIIIYFLPDYFGKYKLELKEQTYIGKNFRVYFADLNNNNLSERIIAVPAVNSSFMLHDDKDNLVDQWNFSGRFIGSTDLCWFLDTDGDGFTEIYAVTQKADSIFLNIAVPYINNSVQTDIKTIFIDTINEYNNTFSCGVHGANLSNHKINGVKEVLFTIIRGFGGSPRNAYAYNSKTHQIKKSEHLTNISYIVDQADINNDGFDELMFSSDSYGNELDSTFTTRSDYSLWINVLDHDLNFVFNPVEIKMPFSRLNVMSYTNEKKVQLIVHLYSRQQEISKSKLLIYSNEGILINEKELPLGLHQLFLNSTKNGFLLFNTENGQLKKINFKLETLSVVPLEPNSELFEIDINNDGQNEWLNVPLDKSKFCIYQENFKDKQSFDFSNSDTPSFYYGIKKTANNNQLYIQNNDYYYTFNYLKNPYFYFKYLAFLIIYVLVLGFVLLIIKGQKIRTEKQRAMEKEIVELQLKTIKNQVDPHFVFNAINTISGLMLTDKKLEADKFICNFSDLMRSTLQKSDKVFCSLQEEIEYVKKYMELQQVRFNQQFKYQFKIAKSIDLNANVPKHILYTYIENAIKHGINSNHNLLIKIDILERNDKLVLIIEDNGGGFDASKKTKTNSTGSGLLIMEKIYDLYAKLYKKKILHDIKEITDDKNKSIGVKASVLLSR